MSQTDFNYRTDTPDLVENWPYDYQYIGPDKSGTYDITGDLKISGTFDVNSSSTSLYDYLGIFASELRRIDVFIDELYEQRFIGSATGTELEKLGAPLGIVRRADEDDESLRFRVSIGKVAAASDGTADDIESILSLAFGDERLADIDVGTISGEPIVSFTVPEPYISDIPISETELNEILTEAFPCGTATQIITGDTFELGASGSKGLGNGRLT